MLPLRFLSRTVADDPHCIISLLHHHSKSLEIGNIVLPLFLLIPLLTMFYINFLADNQPIGKFVLPEVGKVKLK